jgi:hypothetical protein
MVDCLVETSGRLELPKNAYLQELMEMALKVSPRPRRVVENIDSRTYSCWPKSTIWRLGMAR